ncbi:carboxyl transferase domain-containing protein [Parafrankia sp. BMG5.11]|uniref:acetyl-CoA carboxylase family protein n=1 Tax=Parafrankia sp. BMG5.11 TaxID=222540 RepID=UPI00103DFBEA|nr:carboxyl transferase domain-containing protein [Parafrankia sp. BMG5.11]TCJ38869.1 carbamoyl-phosphate synthase large subunit [Parafrankia sp. BMG5.11]
MTIRKLLIANRGEIAIRIAATAAEMGVATVMVHSEDDAQSLHVTAGSNAVRLSGEGPAAYLAADQIIETARSTGCDAIHPGYGFLSENAAFARLCERASLTFVGPDPAALDLFGNKMAARSLAGECGVPVLAGTGGALTLEAAGEFLANAGPAGVMLKAVAGGGGRGMRPVRDADELERVWERCRAEALALFGVGDLYAEELLQPARHLEIQVIGDQAGNHFCLGERECSLQRQRQKLVEIAPIEGVSPALIAELRAHSLEMARRSRLQSLCTFEFLVSSDGTRIAFIEANPRLQVEHTVTEEVTGLDLVRLQLGVAGGSPLADLGLLEPPTARGNAVQVRINLETMLPDGTAKPAGGTLTAYSPPSGRGVRVDGFGYAGYRTSPRFDPLLAKLIVSVQEGGQAAALAKADRALSQFRVSGAPTNVAFLRALLASPMVHTGEWHTALIDERAADLVLSAGEYADEIDPTGASAAAEPRAVATMPHGSIAVNAPMIGTVVECSVEAGAHVRAGEEIAVVEAMKMQHGVTATAAGRVLQVLVAVGDTVDAGQPLVFLLPDADQEVVAAAQGPERDLDVLRADLAQVVARQLAALDEARPDAVAKRRRAGKRTARENIEDLCDPGSFVEYGRLVVAGRSRRASFEELIDSSPADGLVMGTATVNAAHFGPERARIATMAYDYTVFAGTQGARNHIKTDRLVELAERWRIPLVLFAEGGGGRPGDTDGGGFIRAFELFPKLSGKVPTVGVVAGRCFAGNAALLGCCDVIIATRDTTLGMGGPAMIEGGGLGVFAPEEVGPAAVHVRNGVIDILVDDEAQAVDRARDYLSYFQGQVSEWACADQRLLRHAIPENRLRSYDIRALMETLCDSGTILELRRGFGLAMVTALARIEGQPVGLIANDPAHLGGAIDSDAADKAARFMQICERFGLPVLSLSDTPGIMVGPEVEKTGLVRHAARMFLAGSNLTVPILSVVLRKSYGLGAIAMTGGSYQASAFSVAWPTAEFGGMGLEGAVKLGYRKELDAIEDPAERQRYFESMVARLYEHGKALTTAATFLIDDVIDPADTRRWIVASLQSVGGPGARRHSAAPKWIDSW